MMNQKILITGAAGFIGFHLCQKLLKSEYQTLGIDSLNSYYDVSLKKDRLEQLKQYPNFEFKKLDLADQEGTQQVFSINQPEIVVHLAAQAGVRYSIKNPHAYVNSNLAGFVSILEGCRHQKVKHLVYASSSSVYGTNTKVPFSVNDPVDSPVNLYAVTKRANELMAYTYSHLYKIPATGLRFFTVYGPWARPDMAYFSFTRAILSGQPISVFNNGRMRRDFTYIDDIVEGISRVMDKIPDGSQNALIHNSDLQPVSHKLYNIGNNQPVALLRFIEILENCLDRKAEKEFLPMQPGDVPQTYADIDALVQDTGFSPNTPLEIGLSKFANWYKSYYDA